MTRRKRICSVCQLSLKWWNAQSCMNCGQTICKKHACTIRRRTRSSILFTLCTNCALSLAKRRIIDPNAQPGAPRADAAPISFWSSLSGISLSGIKKNQHESNDQSNAVQNSTNERNDPITPLPDVIANNQPEQGVPSQSEPITPFPDTIQNGSNEQNDPPAAPPEEPDQDDEPTN